MGDKLFIFDIDSALDKLEDDLINNEVKSKFNSHPSESQQQKVENEVSVKVNDESISASEKNNGNESSANESLSDVLLDSKYALHKRLQRKNSHNIALQIQHEPNQKLFYLLKITPSKMRTMTHNKHIRKQGPILLRMVKR